LEDSKLNNLLAIGTEGAPLEVRRGRKHDHPQGWQPNLEFDGTNGTATLPPSDGVPNFDDFLVEQGFDPDQFEVVGEPRTSRWQRYDGEWLCSYRFQFRRKTALASVNLDDILAAAKKAKIKPVQVAESAADRTYWLQLTDLQAGQADGDGVAGMVRKATALAELVKADVKALAKAGTPAGSIFIPVTGDLVEGVSGWYDTQTFSVSLDRRDQVKLVRRLVADFLLSIASLGLPVHVAAVPGNHGEFRQNGKAFTSFSDNDDIAAIEQVAEAFALAGIDNVTFSLPGKDRLSLTVEVQGWIVGLTHGHLARSTGSPEAKILAWFKNMAAARMPEGDADILFTGHYHSGKWSQLVGDTEWVQGGALCDASAWFSQSAGLVSDPLVMKGTITRQQRLESVTPYRWPRTEIATRTL
jgi:predicted phosphodiesterase